MLMIITLMVATVAQAQVWQCHDLARGSRSDSRDSKYTIEFLGGENWLVSRGREYPQQWNMPTLEDCWRENLPKYTFKNIQPVMYNGYLTWYFETVASGPHRRGAYVLNQNDYPVAVDYMLNGVYFNLWGGRAEVGVSFNLLGHRIELGTSTQKNYDGTKTTRSYAGVEGRELSASVGRTSVSAPKSEVKEVRSSSNNANSRLAEVAAKVSSIPGVKAEVVNVNAPKSTNNTAAKTASNRMSNDELDNWLGL